MRLKGFILLFFIVVSGGCNNDSDMLDRQRESFESYLKEKVPTSVQSSVYKYLLNPDREGYADSPEVQHGDSVIFRFAVFDFESFRSSTPEEVRGLIYTNEEYILSGSDILNTQYWSFDAKRVRIGDGSLVRGVERGLVGSRQGDSVQLFLTSDLAYGGKSNGTIEEDTPLVFAVRIDTVKKNN